MSKHKSRNQPSEPTIAAHSGDHHKDGDSKAEKGPKRFWRDYEPIEKFNATIAIFTVVYSLVTVALYHVARETMTVSQRAFVFCKEALIVGDGNKPGEVSPDRPALLIVTTPNSGDTPARQVVTSLNFCARPGPLPENFSYPSPAGEPDVGPGLVAPKTQSQTGTILPASTLRDIETARRKLFVYGDIKYLDIFNVWHKTEFCLVYGGMVLKDDGTIDRHYFNSCAEHNCDDEDCPKEWGQPGVTCYTDWPKGFPIPTPSAN